MSDEGQIFEIRIKKECVDIQSGKPPGFYLWAKDRNDLKQILTIKHNIDISEIGSIKEKGSDWNAILRHK